MEIHKADAGAMTEQEEKQAFNEAKPDAGALLSALFAGVFCGIIGIIGCLYMYSSNKKRGVFDKAKGWIFGGVAGFVLQIMIGFVYKIYIVSTAVANGNL
ncbi:MAG: hypothetical protein K6G50_11010 [bacterium]|nr:hypothetical protein [bacterium]